MHGATIILICSFVNGFNLWVLGDFHKCFARPRSVLGISTWCIWAGRGDSGFSQLFFRHMVNHIIRDSILWAFSSLLFRFLFGRLEPLKLVSISKWATSFFIQPDAEEKKLKHQQLNDLDVQRHQTVNCQSFYSYWVFLHHTLSLSALSMLSTHTPNESSATLSVLF